MIRILQIVNNMHRAGLETMLMNYYRRIDRSKIQFDFLTHRAERADYDDEIESMGGKVYYAPRLYPQNLRAYFHYTDHFYAEHPEYQIVHSHIDAMSYLTLKAAKKANVPIRIAHSHNTSIDKDFKYLLKQYYRSRINSVATNYLACGVEAGKYLFRNQSSLVIPNAIEKHKFIYQSQIRKRKRAELGIAQKLVLGHVGRLSYQKNHSFLLDIFNKIQKKEPESILLIIGEGEKQTEIQNKAKSLGIADKICFMGKRSDVNELYQAMDAFLMPSFFEGVPVVGIEAQFAELPCFFSDKVPEEVKFSPICHFIPLECDAKEWADYILNNITTQEKRGQIILEDERYDIDKSYHILEDYYFKLAQQLR